MPVLNHIDLPLGLSLREQLHNYQSLEKTLKELESKIQNNQKERNEVQKLSEKLLNKQKQLQELFQKIMPEEMKNLFKEADYPEELDTTEPDNHKPVE